MATQLKKRLSAQEAKALIAKTRELATLLKKRRRLLIKLLEHPDAKVGEFMWAVRKHRTATLAMQRTRTQIRAALLSSSAPAVVVDRFLREQEDFFDGCA